MSEPHDDAHAICEQVYEQHKLTPYITQVDLMKLAVRACRAKWQREFYTAGYTAGAEHTAATMSTILESGMLRKPLTVRGQEWGEPTDDELEQSEQRGARSYRSLCDDTPDPLQTWTTVPDGTPMVRE
jgi:hypothetical protein